MDLKEEEILGDRIGVHWYYKFKLAAVLRLVGGCLKNTIWDVGAGAGFFSNEILKRTSCQEAICIDTGYDVDREEMVDGKRIVYCRSPPASRPDLVLLMDVLEHVEYDQKLLSDYVRLVSSGTNFLITVPAFKFLWSEHDVFLGHYRRYRLAEIAAVAEGAGLVVVERCYLFGLVFPLAALQRWSLRLLKRGGEPASQMRNFSPVSNHVLGAICAMELPWLARNRVAGLSAVILARKP